MKVAILPTGRTEWHGLGQALNRLFPGHEFYCLPSAEEVASNPAGFPYPGFTSVALTQAHQAAPPEAALELVSRAAQEALGDSRSRTKAADLVLIVDDLELPNMAQAGRVVSVMRRAVETHLSGLQQTKHHGKTTAALTERVSFHLIAPMVEAWFFADPGALARAGVPAGTDVNFKDATDPEAFETDDRAYLAAVESDCPVLAALPGHKRKNLRPKWLGALPRGRHPKGYLQWLCRAPSERECTTYSETDDGAAALAEISWQALFSRPTTHFTLLRGLVEDLEDALGVRPSVGWLSGVPSSLTARSGAPQAAVLRNI